MNKSIKTAILAAAFAVILGAAYFGYSSLSSRFRPETGLSSAAEQPSSGSTPSNAESQSASSRIAAPDFTVYDTDGNAVKLSDFKGKPVVLNFWASWCHWCKQEMPEFNRVYNEKKDEIQFLFVNWTDGREETQEKGEAFLKENGYTFPAYYDLNQEAVSAYGLTGIPATVFIYPDGTIAGGSAGAIDGDTLEQGIELITQQ
ncbi:MAG: Thiol-disulfide oxidoreductase ResA [Clostridium sp.]|jgi:cytochrome c biogenesis protein CcmG, thiol:disulfide interchange protein DsbE